MAFPVGLCTLQVIHHGIAQPSTASWGLASPSQRLSGACYSPHEVAHEAEPQRLKGYLYTPRSCDIPPYRLHGAPMACHSQRGCDFFATYDHISSSSEVSPRRRSSSSERQTSTSTCSGCKTCNRGWFTCWLFVPNPRKCKISLPALLVPPGAPCSNTLDRCSEPPAHRGPRLTL